MKAKRILSLIQSFLCLAVAVILFFIVEDGLKWVWIAGMAGISGVYLYSALRNKAVQHDPKPRGEITELILLSEDNTGLARWNLFGKTGMVIGRDVGENQVTINLDRAAYASMIEIEHAALNYSASHWFIEDLSSRNGISVQKSDGRKYRIAPGKPCRLEKGNIIYIAMTRLLIC